MFHNVTMYATSSSLFRLSPAYSALDPCLIYPLFIVRIILVNYVNCQYALPYRWCILLQVVRSRVIGVLI
jgi:hypothetical protein